jgi:hypothetical protein
MYVFKDEHSYPCMDRKCKPIPCYKGMKFNKSLQKVIAFYEAVIKEVRDMPEVGFNKAGLMEVLYKIDEETANKFKLIRKKPNENS